MVKFCIIYNHVREVVEVENTTFYKMWDAMIDKKIRFTDITNLNERFYPEGCRIAVRWNDYKMLFN